MLSKKKRLASSIRILWIYLRSEKDSFFISSKLDAELNFKANLIQKKNGYYKLKLTELK